MPRNLKWILKLPAQKKRYRNVEKQLERWFAALKSGNATQVAALYARDAILLSTLKGDVQKGRRIIHGYFEKTFLPKHPAGSVVESHIRLLGSVAVNSGIYSFQIDSKEKGRVTFEARYTFVYQWMENDWMIVEHHSSLIPGSEGKLA